jgi:signal transduction histidine kinase/AmiR/NasT family two-component response regulator
MFYIAGYSAFVATIACLYAYRAPSEERYDAFAIVLLSLVVTINVTAHGMTVHDATQLNYLMVLLTVFPILAPTHRSAFAVQAIELVGVAVLILSNVPTLTTQLAFLISALTFCGWYCGGRVRNSRRVLELAQEQSDALRIAAQQSEHAKDEFWANVSHEIRTPLNGVLGVASVLAATRLAPRQKEMVDLIVRSGATLQRLVDDILDLSKITEGGLELERRPFQLLSELQAATLIYTTAAAAKAVTLELSVEEELVLLGDAVRFRQIISNLVSNAVKFTTAGTVGVRARAESSAGSRTLTLIVEVKDTGLGMSPEVLARVFERFRQADSSTTRLHGGTGLGLSIAAALTECMGGELSADSAPGRGSVFTVKIPFQIAQSADLTPAAESVPTRAQTDRRLRVLLVEDHPVNRRVALLMLDEDQFDVREAVDGREAVEAFEQEDFDLVLMDMQMPVMDGLEATRRIRALGRESGRAPVPIVMLSANALLDQREQSRLAGCDAHVAKPVTPDSLMAGIAAAMEGRQAAATPCKNIDQAASK